MSWQDQGRQEHGWFGHGTGPNGEKQLGSIDGESRSPAEFDRRVEYVAPLATASLPSAVRGRLNAQFDSVAVSHLTRILRFLRDRESGDRRGLVRAVFDRTDDDPIVQKLGAVADAISDAASRDELVAAGGNLASVMQDIGLDRWRRFLFHTGERVAGFAGEPNRGAEGQGRLSYDDVRHVIAANNESGLPDDVLVAIAYKESRFDSDAKNGRSSAGGLMGVTDLAIRDLQQRDFIPETFQKFDPAQNVRAASRYLALRVRDKRGNAKGAIAAYGEGDSYASTILAAADALSANRRSSSPSDPMIVLRRSIGP